MISTSGGGMKSLVLWLFCHLFYIIIFSLFKQGQYNYDKLATTTEQKKGGESLSLSLSLISHHLLLDNGALFPLGGFQNTTMCGL